MHQQSVFGDQRYWPLLPRLVVVAATLLAGLLACGGLLAALGGPVPSALAAPASDPIIYPGGVGCATTLQACIDNSPAGTTILIQPNNYYTNSLNLNKAISLTGVSSATVILHGLEDQRVLRVTGAAVDSSVIISGLTFAGGHAFGVGCPTGCGGAIIITGSAEPLLINLTITNSNADWNGGGLYADPGSSLVMSGVAVLSNTAQRAGGGVYGNDIVTISGSLFQDNQCSAFFCQGAGLFAGNSLRLAGTQFLSNTSDGHGAGAYATADVQVAGGVFQNNQCTGFVVICSGAGLFVAGDMGLSGTQFLSNTSSGNFGQGGAAYASGNVTLNGSLFQNNQCTKSGCQGGALFAGAALAVTNTLFLGNRGDQGGALYHNGGDGRLVNDLFAANQAGSHGDALFLASPGSVSLLFTTIASPTVGSGAAVYVTSGTVGVTDTLIASYTVGIENAGGSVQEDYNLFSGVAVPLSPTASLGPHSLTGAAKFVDAAAGDYHVGLGSAAIDTGVDAGITFDIDGDPRPLGNGFDIGYDEVNIRHLFLPLVQR